LGLRDLIRPTANLTGATFVSAAAGFLFWWAAARLYPAEEVGVASSVLSALSLIFALSTLGLNVGTVRFYPKFGKAATGTAALVITVASLSMTEVYILINPGGILTDRVSVKALLLIIAVLGAVYTASGIAAVPLRKTNVFFRQSVVYSTRVIPLPFLTEESFGGIVGSFGTGLLLGAAYGVIKLKDALRPTLSVEFLREALPISFGNYLLSVSSYLPLYFMPSLVLRDLGREMAAYYYAGFMIITLTTVPINQLSLILLREGSKGKIRRRDMVKAAEGLAVYWVVTAAILILTDDALLSIFGSEYTAAGDMLKLASLGIGPAGFVALLTAALNIEMDSRGVAIASALNCLVFLLSAHPFLLRFALQGAALSWILSNSAALLVLLLRYPKTF
jgi:O-antigen/teichoic acid export membrane protein